MSDYEVEEFVLAVSGMHHDELANWLRDGVGLLEHTNPELASCVREGIEFLKSHGIRHDDLHAGNLIVDDY